MFHLDELSPQAGRELAAGLAALHGVREAVVLADEGVALLKVEMAGWDEAAALKLMAVS
jgi:hypothetical protein